MFRCLAHLDALLGEVLGGSRADNVGDDEAVAHRLDGALNGDDAPGALGRHVEIVSDRPRGDLQNLLT